MLNKLFKLSQHNTTLKKEIIAGFITFFSMVYIIFVNPIILSQAGLDAGKVFVVTCVTIFLASLLVAFFINLPLVMGPGLGLSAIFVYDIVLNQGYDYHTALLTVALSGAANFLIFLLVPSHYIVKSIPENLKNGIVAGTGIFLFIIGIKLSGIILNSSATLASLGKVWSIPFIYSIIFFLLLAVAYNKNVRSFPLVAFAVAGIINFFILSHTTTTSAHGPVSALSQALSSYKLHLADFSIAGLNLSSFKLPLLAACVTLFFAGSFDLVGAFFAFLGLNDEHNQKTAAKKLRKVLLVKGISSFMSGTYGSSTMTVFLESTSGVSAGGRTGLVALTAGILFLLALFLKPLLGLIPGWASTPLLMSIGSLMFMSGLRKFSWDDYSEYIPSLIAIFLIPLTYSITNGIALAVITYVLIKIFSLRVKEVHPLTATLAFIFVLYLLV